MQARYLVAVGVLAVLALSACGGSKKTTSASATPAPASSAAARIDPAFIARVDSVCRRAKAKLDARGQFPYSTFDPLHPDVKLLPKVGAFFAARQAVADAVPTRLRRLGSPATGAAAWAQILTLTEQDRAIADSQIRAAKASNVAGFVATVNAIGPVDMKLKQRAAQAGFPASSACVEIF